MFGSAFLVQADARYEIATRNNLGYCFGDTALVNAGLKYNLVDFLNVSFGASYFHSEQADDPDNKYNGKNSLRLTDFSGYTGEDSIWISPGIQIMPFTNASIDFKFHYPVYYSVPDIEQVTDYRVTAGISYSF
jgi:long-subunit fatty acid transport protein